MKKLLLILTFAFSVFFANAQCTPDPQYTAAGIYPDSATGLLPAYVGLAYNQNITIITPTDTVVDVFGQMLPVTIDSINLTNVIGLPASFAYSCDPTSCSFPGGTIKCAALSSAAPTSSEVGLHQIIFETTTYLSNVPFIGTTTQNDVFYYYLEIFGTTTTTWNCINGNCVDPGDGSGQYWNQNACLANCGVPTGPTTYVPDNNFESYLEINGMGDGIWLNDSVSTANINTATYLNVNNQSIADLTGIEDFTTLTTLNCSGNQLSSLDVSQNTALTYLDCESNQLTSLDVSQNTALTNLYCTSNQFTSLDLSQNSFLAKLYCGNNQLSSLNVSGATALTTLWCWYNQLTSLDVSQNTALTYLDCSDNQLSSLDVSQNTALDTLVCADNHLTSLDISQNTVLTILSCDLNQLTSLNVSQNTALTNLDCWNNQLTSLNLSQNTALIRLMCDDNQLSSLDVRNGNNTNFQYFYASSNPNLYCIDVDDDAFSTFNWTSSNYFGFDSQHYFSNNCNPSAIQEQTTNKELLKVTDLLGRETKATNQLLFYIYNDGTVEKKIIIE